jgi:hypothetical protein
LERIVLELVSANSSGTLLVNSDIADG